MDIDLTSHTVERLLDLVYYYENELVEVRENCELLGFDPTNELDFIMYTIYLQDCKEELTRRGDTVK